jgi:hypothetical protein
MDTAHPAIWSAAADPRQLCHPLQHCLLRSGRAGALFAKPAHWRCGTPPLVLFRPASAAAASKPANPANCPVVFVALSVAVCLVPAWLLRRQFRAPAQDFCVASQFTPLDVTRNSSIAYSLRVATFGPLFAWGASGDIWPVIVGSTCIGLGLFLVSKLRGPILEFVGGALGAGRSITVHAFIASRHGNDPNVGLVAASLTLVTLFGLIVGEAVVIAELLKPVLMGGGWLVWPVVTGMLTLTMLCAVFSGTSGAMSCAQLQLGMTYLGLFGSAALLFYLLASTLGPMPAHGMLAIVLVPACCALVLVHRRGKYVDTSLILTADAARPSLGATLLRMFQRVLKRCITFFVVLVVVIAGMLFYATGLPAVGRESMAALTSGTHVPAAGLIALVLFPLLHPMVDVGNWQRMAAVQKHIDAAGFEPGLRARVLNSFFRTYGTESPLLWLFMCMFGAVAVVATETPAGAHVMAAFMAQLVADPNEATVLILPLLLAGVCAMALAAMISMFSASLCTIRYDIVPWFWPEPAPGAAQAAPDATAMRRTVIAGAGFLLAVAAAFLPSIVADRRLERHISRPAVRARLRSTLIPVAGAGAAGRADAGRRGRRIPEPGARDHGVRRTGRRGRRGDLCRHGTRGMALGRCSRLPRFQLAVLCDGPAPASPKRAESSLRPEAHDREPGMPGSHWPN